MTSRVWCPYCPGCPARRTRQKSLETTLFKMAAEEQSYVQVRFFTKQKRYEVSTAPFSVPSNVGSDELNELINGLLTQGDADSDTNADVSRNMVFEFLIDGEYLLGTVEKHMKMKQLSTESVVEIEYIEKHPAPRPEILLLHDDWVSSISVCHNCILSGSYDKSVHVWDLQGTCLSMCSNHTGPVKSVDWISADDSNGVFLSSSHDQSIHLSEWSCDSGTIECIHICKGHSQSVDAIAVDPTATKFCSGSWDKTLKVWSAVPDPTASDEPESQIGKAAKKQKTSTINRKATTRTPLMTLSGHTQGVSSVLWLNPAEVCSAGWDHCIRLWDVEVGVNKHTLNGTKVFCSISYSPLSQCIVSGSVDKFVRLWDPRTADGTVVKCALTSHQGWVPSVAWSPNNEFELVSGSYDMSVKLWDTRSPSSPLYTMTNHQDKVMSVNWTLSKFIMSGGADNQLILFNISGSGLKLAESDSGTDS